MKESQLLLYMKEVGRLFNKGKNMKKKEAAELKSSIEECKVKLRAIIPYLGDNKPILNEKFNKILIEKAVLRQELIQKRKPFFAKLAEKIIQKPDKELICDYFNCKKA